MRDAVAPSALASSIPTLAASAPSSVPALQPHADLSQTGSDEDDSEDMSDSGTDGSVSANEDEDVDNDDCCSLGSLIENFLVSWASVSDTLNPPNQYHHARTPFFCFDPSVVTYLHRYCEGRNHDFIPPEERDDVASWLQALVHRGREHVRASVDAATDPDDVPLHNVFCFFRVCIRRDASTNQIALILSCIDELGVSDELMSQPIASTATIAKVRSSSATALCTARGIMVDAC